MLPQIHVPLVHSANANFADQHIAASSSDGEDSLLPSTHLTPTTLLGGSTSERETIGQLYATQIASAIVMKDPQEQRTVVVGLGLIKFEANRDTFYDIIDMVMASL